MPIPSAFPATVASHAIERIVTGLAMPGHGIWFALRSKATSMSKGRLSMGRG
jgi:hypothetical protein